MKTSIEAAGPQEPRTEKAELGKSKQHAADYEAADCGCALDVLARQRFPDQDNRAIDQNEIDINFHASSDMDGKARSGCRRPLVGMEMEPCQLTSLLS